MEVALFEPRGWWLDTIVQNHKQTSGTIKRNFDLEIFAFPIGIKRLHIIGTDQILWHPVFLIPAVPLMLSIDIGQGIFAHSAAYNFVELFRVVGMNVVGDAGNHSR